jgi:Ca2+-binding RTX toxin-like protein
MRTFLIALSVVGTCLVAPLGHATADDPTPRCQGKRATIVGTPARDVLVGTAGPDVIAGLGGNDRIEGLAGDDVICGGEGADGLFGGEGDDVLLAGRARWVDNRAGSGYRPDRLDGGPGNDLLDIGAEPVDRGLGISGQIRFGTAPGGVRVDLVEGTATGDGDDTIVPHGGLRVIGSAFADVMIGSAGPEELLGMGGPDRIEGGGGDDRLYGDDGYAVPGGTGAEDDVLVGGAGKDVLEGEQGTDVFRGGPGLDLVLADCYGACRLTGGGGDDIMYATLGTDDGVVLAGGSGRDTITFDLRSDVSPRKVVAHVDTGVLEVGGQPTGTFSTLERFSGQGGVTVTVSP